jgi:catechol 2,3-dioxygenase-like lactoylglutathione lyase family enzyme
MTASYDALSPRPGKRSGVSGFAFVEALLEGVPGEGGALDAHGELHDALEGLEVAEADALELGGEVGVVERVRAAGGRVTEEPADQPWGERVARVLDPDGNEVIIGQKA